MEASQQNALRFIDVTFTDIDFKSRAAFDRTEYTPISVDIDAFIHYPKEYPSNFNIVQKVTLEAEGYFYLHINAIGTFELSDTIDEDQRKAFINVNAPAIMFPYVRSFITTLTSNLGTVTGAITIPPQFFSGELSEIEFED